ncbi:unnamed protein product [Ectocarpus sp. 12 AP-2014]
MVNLIKKTCAHPACEKTPSYGAPDSKKREYCARHAPDGMRIVCNKKCISPNCTKSARYGEDGSQSRNFCGHHAHESMTSWWTKRCGHQEGRATPSFGVVGSKTGEFCPRHAKKDMVDIRPRIACVQAGCLRPALFGIVGNVTATFCRCHVKDGTVQASNVPRKRAGSCGNKNRARKRPRHPGDASPLPAPVKEELCLETPIVDDTR